MEYGIRTTCIYGKKERLACDQSGAISFPIYQTATFAHHGIGESTGYDYSRLQNPTREQLEAVVSALENGEEGFAYSSGMAAISNLFELFSPQDHIITDTDLYGGSIRLFNHVSKKNHLTFSHIDLEVDNLEEYIRPETKAIFLETPTNPMMHVIDLKQVANIAKRYELLLIVDNTFLSPYLQNPLDLGAHIVVHSGTKYLGGHNDTIAGFLVTNQKAIAEKLRFLIKTTGAGLAPFDSWLILRGIKTLPIRMEASMANAKAIVEWLQTQSLVKQVYYPGIEGTKAYEISKRQARGFGCMITFEVESVELAHYILDHVRLIQFAESLGGVETLITYPITQTHADVPAEQLKANKITDKILRLSIGIEDKEDLIEELEGLFNGFSQETGE